MEGHRIVMGGQMPPLAPGPPLATPLITLLRTFAICVMIHLNKHISSVTEV